jgi:hypothetical protein
VTSPLSSQVSSMNHRKVTFGRNFETCAMETARYPREGSSLEMDESDGQPARAEEFERRACKCDVTFREAVQSLFHVC